MTRGPVLTELLSGLERIGSEVRRLRVRFFLQLSLHRINQVERRAIREVDWQRRTLREAEANLSRLKLTYANHRRSLLGRLSETQKDATGGRDAAA
ncbi:hypothetical protein PAP18089_03107 [Pandoraea apista]|uniref:Uncharacterized protein n=1 Tax=Pandoraea apista TaxID=93218 RepID=A0A5E5P6Z2_9BURK|nr:hypothetical protein PAP18089_03107 [Pandoraea apista]